MKCYVCGSQDSKNRNGKCRDNDGIKILECMDCGLVYLSDFSHITEKFYEENGQAKSNKKTKIFNSISSIDTQRRFEQFALKLANKRVLDFGCGEGEFLSKLQDENITQNLFSLEINKEYSYALNKQFDHFDSIDEVPDNSLDYITMFHVVEHLPDPVCILNKLYEKLKIGGRIIIEVPSSDDILIKTYKNQAFQDFTYWSCHLYLFNLYTLGKLIDKSLFKVDYIKQYQRYSLANHLYWLSKGMPSGHIKYAFLEDYTLNQEYSKKLAELGQCDTIIAEIIK
ncbi:class I SAM-dependent methyltransferase [Francisella sp. SYW-2]|uniref:class I SAM-dependent methyltransferase n=1 Tax=Francisella sp. SYW-2 TaxID=2610886 RepID=UPI00123CC7A9|nr:class I SAM-dependent methyltransferase [Francisella sp. SYW-2]